MPIELYFVPNSDKEVNFNLVCRVKRKVLPVTLNVKAEGYAMNCQLLCEDSQGVNKEFVSDGINIIRFGEVHKVDGSFDIFVHEMENKAKYTPI